MATQIRLSESVAKNPGSGAEVSSSGAAFGTSAASKATNAWSETRAPSTGTVTETVPEFWAYPSGSGAETT